jgi:monothiol glutaredoxin
MTRQTLPESAVHSAIRNTIATHHSTIVDEVKAAISSNAVVVVGMGQNPFAKKARKALNTIDQAYKYLEYGNYLSKWRERNALKMWCGWPTIPMVFVKGTLIGGANDLEKLISSGELKKMLTAKD